MSDPVLPSGFRLVRLLGQSPLCEVFLVLDPGGEPRALKLLRPSVAGDPRILERWRREAQLLQEIDHPNLIKSFGELQADGRPGLLLEYIEGASLRDRLKDGPLEWEQAARIGVQVARALERLHRHGAVHRDVKPHNVLLDARRGAVLADLGLVRRQEDPELTRHGSALGSPAYMSPEQARDPSEVGPAADVYSLGATLHHALSGAPPFLGAGVGEVLHRVLHLEPEALPPAVPEPLCRVLAVAMAKDPERRYSRAADLRTDLARVLTGVSPRLVTAVRRRRWRRAAAALAAVALLGAAGWLLGSGLAGVPGEDGELGPAESVAVEPDREEGRGAPAGAPLGPPAVERAVELRYRDWAWSFDGAWRRFLARGQLRLALDELDGLASQVLPDGVGAAFREYHQQYLSMAEREILRRAEMMAVEAEDLLDESLDAAAAALAEDPFYDLVAWEESVRVSWAERRLRVEDLPLRPGGTSPNGKLRNARDRLRDEQARALSERAAAAIPVRRARVHEALQAGGLEEAIADWRMVEPALLAWSREARCEQARLDALAELDASAVYEEPLGRLRSRLAAVRSEQDWLLAQLSWCRGRLDEALELMRPLMAERWPPDRDPAFWVAEWERERQLVARAATARTPEPGATDGGAAAPDPLALLASRWADELPEARVEVRDGGLELSWTEQEWGPPWQCSLPWDRLRFRLAAWRLAWQHPADAPPPRLVRWFGEIELVRSARPALPLLRVGAAESTGMGILPGVEQTLEMRDDVVYFDGIEVGRAQSPGRNRLVLEHSAQPGFRLRTVWLRVVPR